METKTTIIARQPSAGTSGWQHIVLQIITLLCILLFVYAATSKLLDYQKFKVQIGQASALKGIAGFLAGFIPVAEFVIADLLMSERYKRIGFVAFTGLMAAFSGYIIWAYYFSPTIPCSCGGVLESLGWVEHLIFNAAFILFSSGGLLIIVEKDKKERRLMTKSTD